MERLMATFSLFLNHRFLLVEYLVVNPQKKLNALVSCCKAGAHTDSTMRVRAKKRCLTSLRLIIVKMSTVARFA